jgi:hypothetical protein
MADARVLKKIGNQLVDAASTAPIDRRTARADKAFTLLMGMYMLALAEIKELKGDG